MRYILIRASRYKMYRPLRNALGSYPIPTLQPRTPSTILKRILGLIQSLWLGFAEPLCGEAGAKAPASLNFLLDKVSDQGIAPPAAVTQGRAGREQPTTGRCAIP